MQPTFATICAIIASFFLVVAVIMLLADEPDFAGIEWYAWGTIGVFFLSLAHWVPGRIGGPPPAA